MNRVVIVGMAFLSAAGLARAQQPTWERLQKAYTYDASKPVVVKEKAAVAGDKEGLLHFTLTGPKGERVPGIFWRPKPEGVYPVVLLLHGLTSDKETMIHFFGEPLVARGFAVLALDAPHHGERKVKGENQGEPIRFSETMQEGVREYRRALDYLETRKDVDKSRVGLLGYSMGSMMGSILGSVDRRIHAFALCVGGDPVIAMAATLPVGFQDLVYNVSPSLFIGHIAPRPILMLNGKQDTTMPKTASDLLYNAAKEPKQQLWFDSGHLLPHDAGEKAVAWLQEKANRSAKH